MATDTCIIVTARNEAARIQATLSALSRAFPGAPMWVADDGSRDGTGALAEQAGATVVSGAGVGAGSGKGGAATLAAERALAAMNGARGAVAVLCDGDLGESAARLAPLVDAVGEGGADIAVAAFARRVGGGFGLARGFAGWAIRRRCGLRMRAPISGQRALSADALARVLPFADGFGMEIGMTIDAARAGLRVQEIELDLLHRTTGRTLAGFIHRGRQLRDFVKVYLAR
jgi:glycosyltransferase involved in cell wall biosynthesis